MRSLTDELPGIGGLVIALALSAVAFAVMTESLVPVIVVGFAIYFGLRSARSICGV